MKSILSLTTFIISSLLLASLPAHAETAAPPDSKAASTTAETFYAGYLKTLKSDAPANKNEPFVAKSKLVTPEFKAAFKKAMNDKELESDPVIFAQEVPITPFKAESSKVKADTATVVLVARYNPKETSTIKVTLIAKDGHWLISKVAKDKYSLGK